MSFWISGFVWDTLIYFVSSPVRTHDLPRRYRRHRRRSPFLRGYPANWLILSNAVLLASTTFCGNAPSQIPSSVDLGIHVRSQLQTSFERIHRLDQLVDLSPINLLRFHRCKYTVFSELFVHTSFCPVWPVVIPPDSIDHGAFFDCYSESPNEKGDHFFDTHDEQIEYLSPDWFDTGSLTSPVIQVDCRYPFDVTRSSDSVSLSEAAQVCLTQTSTTQDIFSFGTVRHPVIFDSGASLGITFDKNDFDGPLSKPEGDLRLGGMASGLLIEGIGSVSYTFRNGNGTEIQIRSNCYYVPGAQVRLISPQRLFNSARGVGGKFVGTENDFKLVFDNGTELTVDYDERNHLPIGYARVGMEHPPISTCPQANVLLLDDANQNLTNGQKLLLEWHYRFGHLNLRRIQALLRVFPFTANKYASASKCNIASMKCSICQYAKAHRRSTHGTTTKVNTDRDGALKAMNLSPGNRVSVDHFESRLLGRTFDSYGKPSSNQYKGGCIFVDHGSGYVHVEHQLGFSAVETIRAKQNFEKKAIDHGVIIQSYLTDSGAFKANAFVDHIRNNSQRIHYCGTNAHHQNGVAERSIRTISNMARAHILHAAAHWPNGIDSSLWPMAVSHATHIYNHTPNEHGVCPADIFHGSLVPRHRLLDFHTWGCPVFVLDPQLQSGQKLPRWQPRSRQGVFMGLSSIHSSEVPLVLNMSTGSITPQFHVVFDDSFSTVPSLQRENDPPSFWNDLCLENTVYIPTDVPLKNGHHLADDWLTESERSDKLREIQRREAIRTRMTGRASAPTPVPTTTTPSLDVPSIDTLLPALIPPLISGPLPSPASSVLTPEVVPVVHETEPAHPTRRSARSNKGQYNSTRFFDEVFLTPLANVANSDEQTRQLAYLAGLCTCYDTGLENISDPPACMQQRIAKMIQICPPFIKL